MMNDQSCADGGACAQEFCTLKKLKVPGKKLKADYVSAVTAYLEQGPSEESKVPAALHNV